MCVHHKAIKRSIYLSRSISLVNDVTCVKKDVSLKYHANYVFICMYIVPPLKKIKIYCSLENQWYVESSLWASLKTFQTSNNASRVLTKGCNCDPAGSVGEICDKENGRCLCKTGFSGARCDRCEPGWFGYPDCQPCECSEVGGLKAPLFNPQSVNPLVPGMQAIQIRQFIIDCRLTVCVVKRLVCLDAHCVRD